MEHIMELHLDAIVAVLPLMALATSRELFLIPYLAITQPSLPPCLDY